MSFIVDTVEELLHFGESTAPLYQGEVPDAFRIKLLLDRRSAEFYINEGEVCLTCGCKCDYTVSRLEIKSGGKGTIELLRLSPVHS